MNKKIFQHLAVITSLCLAGFIPQLCRADIDSITLIVQTKQGKVRGAAEGDVCVWRGIAYANAPVGDLRFRAPQTPDSWTGIKDAFAFGAVAPQIKRVLVTKDHQNEDCLFLNIWSPAADGKKRPVMFWIHGGGFVGGSGSGKLYDGTQLAKKGDVVIVSINYRLGPLGFLYFKDIQGSGNDFENNLGIKDQVAALKWVKENIAAFGGDPGNVTIFGESAGGISVETLMATPSAKGLFRRVIAESGPPEDIWTPREAGVITSRYLKILGIAPGHLSKLKTLSVDTLINALQTLMMQLRDEPTLLKTFAPTVDGDFIRQDMMTCIAAGQCAGVDLLIGTNKNEANLFAMKRLKMAPKDAQQMAPYVARFNHDSIKAVLNTYSDYPHKDGVLDVMTDGIFTMPSIRFAAMQSAYSNTYMYRFDWASNLIKLAGLKACHGLEIPFVFGTFNTPLGKKVLLLSDKKRIYRLSDEIQQAWINFARTGNPNTTGKTDWKKYNGNERYTVIFDKKTYHTLDPKSEQRKAWGNLNIFE